MLQKSFSDVQIPYNDLRIDILQKQYFSNQKKAVDIGKAMHIFNQRDLIACFDELVKRKAKGKLNEKGMRYMEMESSSQNVRIESDQTLHFAFVGDSRMRQLFILFTEVNNL